MSTKIRAIAAPQVRGLVEAAINVRIGGSVGIRRVEVARDALLAAYPHLMEQGTKVVEVRAGDPWPEAVSDGLTLACHDCGEVPRFDYRVEEAFWERWVPGPERTSVVCLPCLDRRCRGEGLGEALIEVQFTGNGHTVTLVPESVYEYRDRRAAAD